MRKAGEDSEPITFEFSSEGVYIEGDLLERISTNTYQYTSGNFENGTVEFSLKGFTFEVLFQDDSGYCELIVIASLED